MITGFMSSLVIPLRVIASAAAEIMERLPQNRPFELSDDGEYLFSSGQRYDFVGFGGDDGSYVADDGQTVRAGKRLGYIVGESGCRVQRLSIGSGTYIMLRGTSDCSEIYRLCV